MAEYLREAFGDAEYVTRDLSEADIPLIIGYWAGASDSWLEGLNVSRQRLGSEADMRARFSNMIRGVGDADRVAFVTECNGDVMSYSNIHIVDNGAAAYLHGHVIRKDMRGKGVGSVRFSSMLRMIIDEFGVKTVIAEPLASNVAVNRLHQSYGLTPDRKWLDTPDGLAEPGWYNLYYFTRDVLDSADVRATRARGLQKIEAGSA
ncbi:GNAT family protein [Embleya sp. NPDC005575]|uniref:GNAT family N-acetyltransferase n=1 Tax=Embleya sp. NPDC005575 TaxID=3156892 RepID=UPI0033AD350F